MTSAVRQLLAALRNFQVTNGESLDPDLAEFARVLFRLTSGQDGSMPCASSGSMDAGLVGPLLLTIEATADVLSVSPATVKRLIKSGALPAAKVEGATRIRRTDVDDYVLGLPAINTTKTEAA